jgi:hypothetical protein
MVRASVGVTGRRKERRKMRKELSCIIGLWMVPGVVVWMDD